MPIGQTSSDAIRSSFGSQGMIDEPGLSPTNQAFSIFAGCRVLAKSLDQPCSTIDANRLTGDPLIPSSRPWECGNPEGIAKGCGKGGKPASWPSMLSILCHFHGLLFVRQCWVNGCATPLRSTYRDQFSVSALAIWHSSRRIPAEKCVRFACQESGAHSSRRLPAIPRE